MSYNTQNFQSGQVLTAEALNTMDNQIQANEQAVQGINDTLNGINMRTMEIDQKTIDINNTTNNIYSYLTIDVMNKLNELSNNSGGNTGGGETTGGIESRFINELGYPMPSVLNSAVDAAMELKGTYYPENTWLNINRPTFIPTGMDLSNVTQIGNTDNILSWNTGYAMPNLQNQHLMFGQVMGDVVLGDMGSNPKIIFFGPLTQSVTFTFPFYLENHYKGQSILFQNCQNLQNVSGLEHIDLTNTEYLSYAFSGCQALNAIPGIESWNTSAVQGMNSLFERCYNVPSLNLQSWNTERVTDMDNMFQGCSNLSSLMLPDNFGCNVQTANCMFQNCSMLTNLNLSNMNPDVTNAWGMFNNCPQLTTLTLPEHFGRSTSALVGLLMNTNVSVINGSIDLASVQDNINWSDGIFWKNVWQDETGTEIIGDFNKIRYLVLHNIGKYSDNMEGGDTINIYAPYWGADNRQCVIDSIVNNSYLRIGNGMNLCTINLYSAAGIELTEEEQSILAGKGYTLNIITISEGL